MKASYEPGKYTTEEMEMYEQYKYDMNEQRPGMPIMEIDDFLRMEYGQARAGVQAGGLPGILEFKLKLHHYNEAYAHMVRRARFADGTLNTPKPERNFFDKLKTLKQVSKGISPESRIRLLDYFVREALTKGQLTEEQASGIYNQLREDKDKIRRQIDTYEENFKKGTALGPRDKIDQLGVGEQVLKEYSEGAGTIELGKKYGVK